MQLCLLFCCHLIRPHPPGTTLAQPRVPRITSPMKLPSFPPAFRACRSPLRPVTSPKPTPAWLRIIADSPANQALVPDLTAQAEDVPCMRTMTCASLANTPKRMQLGATLAYVVLRHSSAFPLCGPEFAMSGRMRVALPFRWVQSQRDQGSSPSAKCCLLLIPLD